MRYYFSPKKIADTQEKARITAFIRGVNEEKRTSQKSAEWLGRAYGPPTIRNLMDVPREEYARYRKFAELGGGHVYVVVHPAWTVFFSDDPAKMPSPRDIGNMPGKNLVERYYEKTAMFIDGFRLLQEQELVLRDFITVMAAEKRLIILILPPDYRKHFTYGYVAGLDEYARYINEVTDGSESVVYLESVAYNEGTMADDKIAVLSDFLKAVAPDKVMLGGGFVGRCLERFYLSALTKVDSRSMFLVPEFTAISDRDIGEAGLDTLLNRQGKINFNALRGVKYGTKNTIRHTENLYVFEVKEAPVSK